MFANRARDKRDSENTTAVLFDVLFKYSIRPTRKHRVRRDFVKRELDIKKKKKRPFRIFSEKSKPF